MGLPLSRKNKAKLVTRCFRCKSKLRHDPIRQVLACMRCGDHYKYEANSGTCQFLKRGEVFYLCSGEDPFEE